MEMHKPKDIPRPLDTLADSDDKEPMIPKAAYLSVVDFDGKVLFEKQIQHLPGTYRVDYFSRITANITSRNQLQNGEPFSSVVEDFKKLSNGKIHVTCGGGNDYRYMELASAEFYNFDLQSFYQRPNEDNPRKKDHMSLRDIYWYHFKADFQRGPHNATVDAKATMKIFRDGFMKLNLKNEFDFSEVPNLKKKAKKNLYWCIEKKAFAQRCSCYGCNHYEVIFQLEGL